MFRGFNLYGETLPWAVQGTTLDTVRAFLNFTKYPPSLDYLLITLGIGCVLLAWFDRIQKPNMATKVLEVYGSVPMFAYFVHLYVLLAAYWILFGMFGATHGDRFGLASVGQIWLGAGLLAALLYLPAKTFSAYKHREKRSKPWLSYL